MYNEHLLLLLLLLRSEISQYKIIKLHYNYQSLVI